MQSHDPDKADIFAESGSAATPKTNTTDKVWRGIVIRRRIPRRRPIGRVHGRFDRRQLGNIGPPRGDPFRPIRRTDLPF